MKCELCNQTLVRDIGFWSIARCHNPSCDKLRVPVDICCKHCESTLSPSNLELGKWVCRNCNVIYELN